MDGWRDCRRRSRGNNSGHNFENCPCLHSSSLMGLSEHHSHNFSTATPLPMIRHSRRQRSNGRLFLREFKRSSAMQSLSGGRSLTPVVSTKMSISSGQSSEQAKIPWTTRETFSVRNVPQISVQMCILIGNKGCSFTCEGPEVDSEFPI
jgi:hypothetical protein